ncbi:MAG: hypothetical protein ABSA92_10590 [Candidatus Bathyarchaeia archaeon]|jgi:hypothetical protein
MKLNTRSLRGLLPIFVTLLIIFEMAAYASTIVRPQEQFFQFYALGSNGMAGNYYPNNSTFLQIGESVQWSLGVVNNMGSVQYVSIRVKLGNQTINPPNDTLATPSPSPLIAGFNQFMPDNGTWQMPFVWQIANYTITPDGHIVISTITINNATYAIQGSTTCQSMNSCNLRLIFELWTWNVDSADFQIGWMNGDQQRIAWLQLWFNLTPGVSHR